MVDSKVTLSGSTESDAASTRVPSARESLAASRGPVPTHAGSYTSPAQPPPSVNPMSGTQGPAGQTPGTDVADPGPAKYPSPRPVGGM